MSCVPTRSFVFTTAPRAQRNKYLLTPWLAPTRTRAMTKLLLPCLVLALVAPALARADDAPPNKLVVGASHAPPGEIKSADGTRSGYCIDAWKDIAREVGLAYEIRDVDPKEIITRGPAPLGVDI